MSSSSSSQAPPTPEPTAPGPVLASGRGCLLWGAIGAAAVLLIFGVFFVWFLGNTTSDPAEARAWAAEMIELEYPPGIQPSSGVRISGSTMVFAGTAIDDPAALSLVVAGHSGEEELSLEDLPRQGSEVQDEDRPIASSEEREFQVRDGAVPALVNHYADGTLDYTLLLPGRAIPDGGAWQVMLIFSGQPDQATPEWVQGVLDSVR